MQLELKAPGLQPSGAIAKSSPIRLREPDDTTASIAMTAPRIAIEGISPSVDNGRFAVKQIVGESVDVAADIFCDGHDILAAVILWRPADEPDWREAKLSLENNDRWRGSFPLGRVGRHLFTVEAWLDGFASYRDEIAKKNAAGVPLSLELREGCALVAQRAKTSPMPQLQTLATRLARSDDDQQLSLLLAAETLQLMEETDPREFRVRHDPILPVEAERKAASFASWYEIFPRSQSQSPDQHGTFDDVIRLLPTVRDMGFDVLYFPPIHPIGKKNRKGRNNSLVAGPDDPGSPYAIGSAEGGHDAVHPELGTIDDFRRLISSASEHGLELALDFAIQCSPDHPWLREHPDWFNWRSDGSIRYAENPPKKYEDIVNVAFYAEGALPSLWLALRNIVLFWVSEGVRIFRVDNPHTKPLPFWEWMIGDIHAHYPDVIFLAEAFTRPKVMYRLAKIGFSQSYTYFTWRNTARELRDYLTELTTTAPSSFFRPHFFVNTPDINPTFLHNSGRPGFLLRAALAATLSGLWGVYNGFELCEGRSVDGREDYLDSEKYQLRHWDLDEPGNIIPEITALNQIRRDNPALHSHLGVRFLDCSNENVLCYVKAPPARDNVLLIIVNFGLQSVQDAEIFFPPDSIGAPDNQVIVFDDVVQGDTVTWNTGINRVQLDPADLPYRILRLRVDAEAQS